MKHSSNSSNTSRTSNPMMVELDGGLVGEPVARTLSSSSRRWSSSGHNLSAAEAEARRLEKKGTFRAHIDREADTVTLSRDDFKTVMGKLGLHKKVAKRTQGNLVLLAFGYLAVSIGFVAVIVGLMNWRLEATKEALVKTGGQLEAKNGELIKVGEVNSEFWRFRDCVQ